VDPHLKKVSELGMFNPKILLYDQADYTEWPTQPYSDLIWESDVAKGYMYVHVKSSLFDVVRFDDRYWSYDTSGDKVLAVLMDVSGWEEMLSRSAGEQ